MTSPGSAALRQVAQSVLTRRASGANPAAIAAAARRAYDDLAGVLVPLIGQVGVDALTARTLHLVQEEYPWAQRGDPEQGGGPLTQVRLWLERQDPSLAVDAAAAMLATFAGLLATFIGEPMTRRLLRKAWPDGFSDTRSEETRA
jgi:hypothetical protein